MSGDFEAEGLKVSQLTDNVWAIDESFVRCYLVEGTERAVLLDSCMSQNSVLEGVVRRLTQKPVDLVFSHTDPDHTRGQGGFGALLLHPAEYDYYSSKGNEGRDVRPLWEGDVLDLGGICMETVLISGHTPGSIALLDRNRL